MKIIRTVAVGLIISAYLIGYFAIDFFKWTMNNDANVMFSAAINAISPNIGNLIGVQIIAPICYIIFNLGAGLLLSSILLPVMESSGLFLIRQIYAKLSVHQTSLESNKLA